MNQTIEHDDKMLKTAIVISAIVSISMYIDKRYFSIEDYFDFISNSTFTKDVLEKYNLKFNYKFIEKVVLTCVEADLFAFRETIYLNEGSTTLSYRLKLLNL